MATFTNNTKAAQRALMHAVAKVLIDFADESQKHLRDKLNRAYPPASKPGEFPARRTGNLRQQVMYSPSMFHGVISTNRGGTLKLRFGIGAKAPYGERLELAMGRLLVWQTMKDMMPRIKGIAAKHNFTVKSASLK